MAARVDFRQRLTNALIQGLEEHDGLPWQHGKENSAARPFNPVSGVKYKGGNVMGLVLEQMQRGSNDPRWMTLKQANKAGYSVRKGAKATYVEYWDWGVPDLLKKPLADGKDAGVEDDETDAQARARIKPRVFYAAVFNGADINGLPEMARDEAQQTHMLADTLIKATGAEIEHAASSRVGSKTVSNAAYYDRQADKIVLPPASSFKSEGDYYATVLAELARWTGHGSRLDRKAPAQPHIDGNPAHAREDLRVQIATFFLTSMLGVEGMPQDGKRFASAWQDVLKGDKHEIFRAARDAEQIVDHIFSFSPELRDVVEGVLEANTLPEDGPKRRGAAPLAEGLPNFIPAGAEPVAPVVRTGRADPRWAGFEQALLETAKKAGLSKETVSPAFDLVAESFTALMDSLKKSRGLDEEMVYKMISTKIIEEMKQTDVHHQHWLQFADQVRAAGTGIEIELVESTLQEIQQKYQRVLVDGPSNRLDDQQMQQALNQVLYGPSGSVAAIDAAFVRSLVSSSVAAQSLATLQGDDEEDMLMPLGMSEVMPDDAGILDDERIARASP